MTKPVKRKAKGGGEGVGVFTKGFQMPVACPTRKAARDYAVRFGAKGALRTSSAYPSAFSPTQNRKSA